VQVTPLLELHVQPTAGSPTGPPLVVEPELELELVVEPEEDEELEVTRVVEPIIFIPLIACAASTCIINALFTSVVIG